MHLLGNMLCLWIFGDNIADDRGHGRYRPSIWEDWRHCDLAHLVATFVLGDNPSITSLGTSGAISGVMGGYLVMHRTGA